MSLLCQISDILHIISWLNLLPVGVYLTKIVQEKERKPAEERQKLPRGTNQQGHKSTAFWLEYLVVFFGICCCMICLKVLFRVGYKRSLCVSFWELVLFFWLLQKWEKIRFILLIYMCFSPTLEWVIYMINFQVWDIFSQSIKIDRGRGDQRDASALVIIYKYYLLYAID